VLWFTLAADLYFSLAGTSSFSCSFFGALFGALLCSCFWRERRAACWKSAKNAGAAETLFV
jgi:hypothetical protein